MKRRELLFRAVAVVTAVVANRTTHGEEEGLLPKTTRRDGVRKVLTQGQEEILKAVFDRLIPGDELGPSASGAGCLDFLDDQLAGGYGEGSTIYRDGPVQPHEEQMLQKAQFISTPRERYYFGLKALEAYSLKTDGASFADLQSDRQDEILRGMETGKIELGEDVNTKGFFELMLTNAREGYFADPCYGGNKDMAGWKMIGFPGARYDYRAYAERTGQELNLVNVSLILKG
ncbi:gluconate 2-dehydrogenase subunit 3 family protein [Sinorhizobium meliloti]|nr:gluconate 2-dehydrogenase subunit 3 family protein [Sinorhizobium meliloti]